ncbi:MAG: Small-conductance mechanosensitive channel [Candidatus Marinimicrobia bacterium]|nr:Small-conductance mechanosensitive channel [Candidatus Neomarinimicrobiota bacterium]
MQNLWQRAVDYFTQPERIIGWLDTLLEIFIILLVARIAIRLMQRVIKSRLKPLESLPDTDPKKQRSKTMLPLLENIISYVIYGLAGVLAIQQLGVDITAILAGAGVVGLAIGFGAQSLVKDLISGFFLLFDGLVGVGDVITIDAHTGLVEKIGIRNTQIRKFSGELRTIPNGDLTSFGNFNRGFMRAIVPVGVAYEANIEDAMAVLRKIAQDYVNMHQDIVLEEPMIQGVMNFNASDVEVRVVIKVVPGNQWQTERDLRRMIKAYFDNRNVEIPFPRHIVYVRDESEWDNSIDVTDTPPEKIEELPDLDKFGEFGVDKENLGKVHEEYRRLKKSMKNWSQRLRGGSSSESSSEEKKE